MNFSSVVSTYTLYIVQGKGKVVPKKAMMTCRGMGVQLSAFLNEALDVAQRPVSCTGCFANEDLQYPLNRRPDGFQCWSASLGIKM
jgi:hypothetical protein